MTATPPFLRAGTDTAAVLELALEANGRPLTGASVSFSTNVGTIEPLGEPEPGRYRARLFAPKERHPQVALVAADARWKGGDRRAWWSIPIHGTGELKLKTKPRAQVTVTVAGQRFGPARADARGNVVVPVVVPPGVERASVHSLDAAGNSKTRSIDLEPPRFSRLRLLAVGPDPLTVGETLPLALFVVNPRGEPQANAELLLEDQGPSTQPALSPAEGLGPNARGAVRPEVVEGPRGERPKILLSADRGSVAEVRAGPPGVYEAVYRSPRELGSGEVTVEARLAGQDASISRIRRALRPGPPVRLELSASAGEQGAGPQAEIELVATAVDAFGNRIEWDDLSFSADLGTVEPRGPMRAVLELPGAFGGRERVTARAARGGLSAERVLSLRAGPAARSDVDSAPAELWTDGRATWQLGLSDAFGNPVTGAGVEVAASRGEAELIELERGRFELLYRPDPDRPGEVTLALRNPGGEPFWSERLQVQPTPMVRFSAGLLAGGSTNFGRALGAGPTAELSARVRRWPVELVLQGNARWFRAVEVPHPDDDQARLSASLWAASLVGGVRYASDPFDRLGWYLFAGAGAQRLEAAIQIRGGVADQTAQRPETSFGPALRAAVGVSHRVGPGRVLAELSWIHAPVAGLQVTGNLGGLGLATGYVWSIP